MRALALLVVFGACGDNADPHTAWGDAIADFAAGWCINHEHCEPELFYANYGDVETCVTAIVGFNCAYRFHCEEDYPWSPVLLAVCAEDLAEAGCEEDDAPQSCYVAFRGPT